MISESARMSSAAEAKFRIQAPNSLPRKIKVIALDEPGELVVRRLAGGTWSHAAFFSAAPTRRAAHEPATDLPAEWFRDLDGQAADLIDVVAAADLIVMVAAAGHEGQAAAMIGEACSHKRVMTTALLVGGESASDEALSKTLAHLRPWSLMVVIANADDYIEDMLIALRGQ